MDIEIREAEEKDLKGILTLYAQPEVDDGMVLSMAQAVEIFKKIKSYPNYKVFVAIINGSIVGSFELLIMDNLAHMGAPSGIIEDVVVSPEYHGRGIGTKMMHFAMEFCKSHGCYKITLSSNLKREKAHKFYESLGFKKHGYSFVVEL